MIVIHIITKEESHLALIAQWLIEEKLVHGGVDVDYQDTFVMTQDNVLQRTTTYKLQARSKASLFRMIEEGLRSNFANEEPYFYSTPIVNMDKQQQQQLMDSTLKM